MSPCDDMAQKEVAPEGYHAGHPVSMNDDRARQPTVLRCCLRNFAGVMPVVSLKSLVKWLCEAKPRSRAMPASVSEFACRSGIDAAIRRRLMNRWRLRPEESRNFVAQGLGDNAAISAMALSVGASRRWASM